MKLVKYKNVSHEVYGRGTVVEVERGICSRYTKVKFDTGHTCDVPTSTLDTSVYFKFNIGDKLMYSHVERPNTCEPPNDNVVVKVIRRDVYNNWERYEVRFDDGTEWFVREEDLTKVNNGDSKMKIGTKLKLNGDVVGTGTLVENDGSGMPYLVKIEEDYKGNNVGDNFWFYEHEVTPEVEFKFNVGDFVKRDHYNTIHTVRETEVWCGVPAYRTSECNTYTEDRLTKVEPKFKIGDNIESIYGSPSGKVTGVRVGKDNTGLVYGISGHGHGWIEKYFKLSAPKFKKGDYVKFNDGSIGKYVCYNGCDMHTINICKTDEDEFNESEFMKCDAPVIIPIGAKFRLKSNRCKTGKVIDDSCHGFQEMWVIFDDVYDIHKWVSVDDIEVITKVEHERTQRKERQLTEMKQKFETITEIIEPICSNGAACRNGCPFEIDTGECIMYKFRELIMELK